MSTHSSNTSTHSVDEQYRHIYDSAAQNIDAYGLKCPEPMMLVHKVIRKIQSQQMLYLVATDPSTERDIQQFCDFLGHTCIDIQKKVCEAAPFGVVLHILLQKK